jgi:hypothetical protein
VAVASGAPTTIYLAAADSSGITKSTDAGKTWSNVFAVFAESIAVDPFDPNHILTGVNLSDPLSLTNSRLQVSHDGGVTWADNPVPTPFHDYSPTSIIFDPSTTGTIYIASAFQNASTGSGVGIAKSTDGGTTWSMITDGLNMPIVYSMAIDPSNSQVVLAGTAGGVYKSADGGATWAHKGTGTYSVAFDTNHAGYVYATDTQLWKSTDDGETWLPVYLGRSDLNGPLTLAIDPRSPDTLFVISWSTYTMASAVGWSADGGVTWLWLTNGLGHFLLGGNGSVSAVSSTNPEVLYIPSSTVGLVSLTLQH